MDMYLFEDELVEQVIMDFAGVSGLEVPTIVRQIGAVLVAASRISRQTNLCSWGVGICL